MNDDGSKPLSLAEAEMRLRQARAGSYFHKKQSGDRSVTGTTKSGRKFSYDTSQIVLRPGITPDEANALAKRIIADKYRFCEWSKDHGDVEDDKEIVDALTLWTLKRSKTMISVLQPELTAYWAVKNSEDQVVATFSYGEHAEAERYADGLRRHRRTSFTVVPVNPPTES